jgi:hypothetical protein
MTLRLPFLLFTVFILVTLVQAPATARADVTESDAIHKVTALPEYQHYQKLVEKAGHHVQIDPAQRVTDAKEAAPNVPLPAWRIDVYEDLPEHRSRWQTFLVSAKSGALFVYDVVQDRYLPLKQWRAH